MKSKHIATYGKEAVIRSSADYPGSGNLHHYSKIAAPGTDGYSKNSQLRA